MLSPDIASISNKSATKIGPDVLQEIKEQFNLFCANEQDFIKVESIQNLFAACGEKIPAFKIRQKLPELQLSASDRIYFHDFQGIFEALASKKLCTDLAPLTKKASMQLTGGASCVSSLGTQHSYDDDDKVAFTEWVNLALEKSADVAKYLPIDMNSPTSLFEAIKDGIILCKLINWASPGTIDERAINKSKLNVYTIHENLTLALNSATSVGCNLVNIGPEDVLRGAPHLVLGLLWQILRVGLLTNSGVKNVGGFKVLLEAWETEEDFLRMTSEDILIRWVNYHLKQAGSARTVKNFASDLKDSEVYSILFSQIFPEKGKLILELPEIRTSEDLLIRAQMIIDAAVQMKCRRFIRARDIVNENSKLNLAFLCNCFKLYPGLEIQEKSEEEEKTLYETREEKTFRNWINSLGVEPFVSDLHHELQDGWALLQVLGIISERNSRAFNLKRFNKPPFRKHGAQMKRLENCNEVVKICTEMRMSTIGIAGSDIANGNIKLTLAIVWQMMKLYTLLILQQCSKSSKPITELQIIQWTNSSLERGGKQTRITGFKDQSISTSIVILDLIDVLRPKSVNYSLVRAGNDTEEKLMNANYAVSLARKIGAKVYALPEDIVEVRPRMVMTVFACLMAREILEQSNKV